MTWEDVGKKILEIAPTAAGLAWASAAKDGYFMNKSGVTSFTFLSVHWADRMTAVISWY